jgi:hypothetical protein
MSGKSKLKKDFQIIGKSVEAKQESPVKKVEPAKTKKDVQSKSKKGN